MSIKTLFMGIKDHDTDFKSKDLSVNVRHLSLILTLLLTISAIAYTVSGVFLRVAYIERSHEALRADFKILERRLQDEHEIILEIRNKVNTLIERKHGTLD